MIVFDEEDLEIQKIREFSQLQNRVQHMKKVLFKSHQDLQMKCDFLVMPQTDSIAADHDQLTKANTIAKYRQKEAEFNRHLLESNKKYVKDF